MSRATRRAVSRAASLAAIIIIIIAVLGGIAWYLSTRHPTPVTTTAPSVTLPTISSISVSTPKFTVTTPNVTVTKTTTTTTTTITTTTTTTTKTSTTSTTTTTTKTATATTTSKTTTAPSKGIVLRVLTRHPSDILDQAKIEFLKTPLAKKYHIVNIIWLPIEPTEWIDTIKYAAQRGEPVDIAWGGGPTIFNILMQEGLLATINSSDVLKELKYIPKEIAGSPMIKTDKEGHIKWIAAAIASFGFTINKAKLKEYGLPTPQKWSDLASPIFAITLPTPMVGVADPTKSTSNTRMFQIILQIYGWEKGWEIITRMAANARIYFQSGLVRDAVIRGDIAVGITIDFYGYTAQLENPKECKYILPKDGTIVNGDPIAMLKTTKHPKAAQAFIAWVLSPQGQALWMNPKINRMPINPLVFNETPQGRARPDLKAAYERTLHASTIKFNETLAEDTVHSMRWFFYATLTQAHETLQKVWRDIALAYLHHKITEEQFEKLVNDLANPDKFQFKDPATGKTLTFTLKVAEELNNKIFNNVSYRNQLIAEWTKLAKQRYLKVDQELKSLIGG